ncbi:MAG: hypothetical protein AAB037_06640, partial [Chloroflexota bacterium]
MKGSAAPGPARDPRRYWRRAGRGPPWAQFGALFDLDESAIDPDGCTEGVLPERLQQGLDVEVEGGEGLLAEEGLAPLSRPVIDECGRQGPTPSGIQGVDQGVVVASGFQEDGEGGLLLRQEFLH